MSTNSESTLRLRVAVILLVGGVLACGSPPTVPDLSFDQCPPPGVPIENCTHPGIVLGGPDAQSYIGGYSGRWVSSSEALKDACESPCRVIDSVQIVATDSWENLADLKPLTHFERIVSLRVARTSLKSLSGLETVQAFRTVEISDNPELVSLNGLQNATALASLEVSGNSVLQDLSGLEHVRSADTVLIQANNSLVSLRGLEGLRSADELSIYANPNLRSLAALKDIEHVDDLMVLFNLVTAIDAFERITSISKSLIIGDNPLLASLSGLRNLRQARWGLKVVNHPKLPRCEVDRLIANVQTNDLVVANNSTEAPACEN